MAEQQFKEQGGAATMDPSPFMRFMTSRIINRIKSSRTQEKKHKRAERERVKAGAGHVVHYFHQVDEGYSQLAAQCLSRLADRYEIELHCHLVTAGRDKNSPEPELLLQLSRNDAAAIAPEYGLAFPAEPRAPSESLVALATAILAAQDDTGFAACAADVGRALWDEDQSRLEHLADVHGRTDKAMAEASVASGNALRDKLGHYSGAMFYYGDEWYWGVDRLYHLEARLAALGADRRVNEPMLAPRQEVQSGPLQDDGSLTLEIYASLRSPYTAVAFDQSVELARATGVNFALRPVLPMVMRGVPATRTKGMYIFSDAGREARAAGVPFDKFYDPIGDPARRGYGLYRFACEQGKGVEMFSALLHCAFHEGVNLNRDSGLKRAVKRAGLDWQEARKAIGREDWREELEQNRLTLYERGLWGVPSFRLLDAAGEEILALWGQDRLWLFAREIQRQLQQRAAAMGQS